MLQGVEIKNDVLLTCDYNQSGYFLIDRSTKEAMKLEEATGDNRGCFDLQMLPTFDMQSSPFVFAKARKAISLLNLKTRRVYQLIHKEEMQSHTDWEKLNCRRVNGRDLQITYVHFRENMTFVEQIIVPDLFFRAL